MRLEVEKVGVLEHGIGSPAIVIIGDVVGVAASVSSTSQILEEQI